MIPQSMIPITSLQTASSIYYDDCDMDDFQDALSQLDEPEPTHDSIDDSSETCCSETGCSVETASTTLTRVSFAKNIVTEVWEEKEADNFFLDLSRLKSFWISSKKSIVNKIRKPQIKENKRSMYY